MVTGTADNDARGDRLTASEAGGQSAGDDQQEEACRDAVPGEHREAVRLDVAQQPFHGRKGHYGGDGKGEGEGAPVLARKIVAAQFHEFVAGRREHGGDADQQSSVTTGRPLTRHSISRISRPPMSSAPATGATVSGSVTPSCFAA